MLHIPPVIGHRGAALRAPENTLAGLREAARLGARMVEFDAKLSRDGVPVLFHDEMLERTTDGRGPVERAPLAALRALDAGSKPHGPAFAGERVPTLAEGLRACLALGLAVNMEIKPCPGRELETAAASLRVLREVWPASAPAPLVSSFEVPALLAARRIAPALPRGYLIYDRPPDWRAIVAAVEPATLNVCWEKETPESLAEYRATGLPVLVYTVNDPARARALFAAGVAAVFTDAPDLILPVT